jgi:hypothetical protein
MDENSKFETEGNPVDAQNAHAGENSAGYGADDAPNASYDANVGYGAGNAQGASYDANAGYGGGIAPNAGYGNYGQDSYNQNQYGPQGQPPYNAYNSYNPYTGEVPREIKKWNWGAFALGIFWGIGNHAYLTLLPIAFSVVNLILQSLISDGSGAISVLFSLATLVWLFVCGARGNQWAWKSGEFKDVETFLAVQRTWNRAGIVAFVFAIIVVVISIILFAIMGSVMFSMLQSGSAMDFYDYL